MAHQHRTGCALFLSLVATVLAAGCRDSLAPQRPGTVLPTFSHGGSHPWTRIAGLGIVGNGSATPGADRQELDFDVSAGLMGRVFYRDWSVVRWDGTVGSLTVDPADSGTAITAFRDGSAACSDSTRGAEFDGIGRLDFGDLVGFTLAACDNGAPGSAPPADVIRLVVQPPHDYTKTAVLRSGDVSPHRHYRLSPTGNDLNPCTLLAPCLTMERVGNPNSPGVGKLAAGDVAHFAAGQYLWPTPQIVSAGGTSGARVTYLADERWGARLVVSGTIGGVCGIMKNTGDHVDIIGFDMTYEPAGTCALGLLQDGDSGRVIGNRIHDLTGPDGTGTGAIIVDCCVYTRTGNQVIGNVVDNIGPPNGGSNLIHGIYIAGPGNSAINNIVTRASAACISSYHGATRLIIVNNVLANCGRYGITISADAGAGATGNDSTTVTNNIVVNNGQLGIQEYCEQPEQGPARVGPNNVYYNNIVYNSPGGLIVHCDGDPSNEDSTIAITSTEFAELFVNYTGDVTGDYRLRAGARGIDAGTQRCAPGIVSCAPARDFGSVLRPQGTAWDIGAYEFIP